MRVSVANIAAGASQSDTIDLGDGDALLSLEIPAGWTAASITFLADAQKDGTFSPVFDESGTELTIASANVVAGRHVILNATGFMRLSGWVKLRSGSAAVPVNQVSAAPIVVKLGRRFI